MSLAATTRAETTKQFTTSLWWILLIVMFAYLAFVAGGMGAALGANASDTGVPEGSLAGMIYSSGSAIGYVFPLLIGTLIVTGEFRHKTLTPTFLATPKRGQVLVSKFGTGLIMGLLYGVVGVIAAVGTGGIALSIFGVSTGLGDSDTWALVGRMLLALVLWVLVGIGVGVLVRNQVAAIVIVLAFTQFVEPILRVAAASVEGLRPVGNYLPGGASDVLVGSSLFSLGSMEDAPQWWVGAIVLVAYGVVLTFIGYFTSWRRDVV